MTLNDVPAPSEPGSERILGYVGKEPVINTQAVLAATGPFGAIDALDPGARLRQLMETAVNFRNQYPSAPVRATELAVNEVLKLRGELEAAEQHLKIVHAANNNLVARHLKQIAIINELRRPWWKKFFKKAPKRSLPACLRKLSDVYFEST